MEQKVENIHKWNKGRKREGWNTNHVDTRPEKEGPGQWMLSDGCHRDHRLKLGGGRALRIYFFPMLTRTSPASPFSYKSYVLSLIHEQKH